MYLLVQDLLLRLHFCITYLQKDLFLTVLDFHLKYFYLVQIFKIMIIIVRSGFVIFYLNSTQLFQPNMDSTINFYMYLKQLLILHQGSQFCPLV